MIRTPQPTGTASEHPVAKHHAVNGSKNLLTAVKLVDAGINDRPEPRNRSKTAVAGCITHGEVLGESLKCTGIFNMLENVSSRVPPLNGVVAYCKAGSPSAWFPVTKLATLTIIS